MLRQLPLPQEHLESFDNGLTALANVPGLAQALIQFLYLESQNHILSVPKEEAYDAILRLQGVTRFLERLDQELQEIKAESDESPLANELEIELHV